MFGHRYYGARYFGPRYWGDGSNVLAPPNFSGTIPDISKTQNTGSFSYALGAYFTGATSYSIAPAVETGWSFDTSTGEFVIDTDAVGLFGGFTVTGTNLAGSADSNSFTVTVTAAAVVVTDQPTGGWLFLNSYEAELQRKRARARRRKELEEESEQIQDAIDRQIAQLLRVQEAKDEKREDLKRLERLAKEHADLEAAKAYSAAVGAAYAAALEKGTTSALSRLERELKKARDEEEFMALAAQFLVLH